MLDISCNLVVNKCMKIYKQDVNVLEDLLKLFNDFELDNLKKKCEAENIDLKLLIEQLENLKEKIKNNFLYE